MILFNSDSFVKDKITSAMMDINSFYSAIEDYITYGELNIFVYDDLFNFVKVPNLEGWSILNKKGMTNIVISYKNMKFTNCKIKFINTDNKVIIKKTPYRTDGLFLDIDKENIFYIDENFQSGSNEFRLREKRNIFIGKDNMYSSKITFWRSDGHAILDENNKCINKASDLVIGDHVWIGHGARILKSVTINDGSIVGGGCCN